MYSRKEGSAMATIYNAIEGLGGDECRSVLGKCFITSAANIKHAIGKHVWMTCCFEVLGTNGFCIFLLSLVAPFLEEECPI
eukprot:Skav223498  [mRNA]  locus=scaffold1160:74418:74660:+ [translate_table: standard]